MKPFALLISILGPLAALLWLATPGPETSHRPCDSCRPDCSRFYTARPE